MVWLSAGFIRRYVTLLREVDPNRGTGWRRLLGGDPMLIFMPPVAPVCSPGHTLETLQQASQFFKNIEKPSRQGFPRVLL